jgi:hypothetical protein
MSSTIAGSSSGRSTFPLPLPKSHLSYSLAHYRTQDAWSMYDPISHCPTRLVPQHAGTYLAHAEMHRPVKELRLLAHNHLVHLEGLSATSDEKIRVFAGPVSATS